MLPDRIRRKIFLLLTNNILFAFQLSSLVVCPRSRGRKWRMRYATTRRSTTRVGAGVVRSTPPPSPEGEGGLEPPLTQQTETPQYSTLLSNHHQQKLADLSPTPPGKDRHFTYSWNQFNIENSPLEILAIVVIFVRAAMPYTFYTLIIIIKMLRAWL